MDEVTVTQADQDCAEIVLGEMVLGNEKRARMAVARHRTTEVAAATADLTARLAAVEALLRECRPMVINNSAHLDHRRALCAKIDALLKGTQP